MSTTGTQTQSQIGAAQAQAGLLPAGVALRPQERRNAVTVRAILLGLVLCALAGMFFPYTDNVIRGSQLAEDHTAVGVIAMFFIVVFVGNTLARLIERRWRSSPLAAGVIIAAVSGVALYGCSRLIGAMGTTDATGAVVMSAWVSLLRVIWIFGAFMWMMFALVVASRLTEALWAGGRWLSLNRAEMLTVFAMLLIATAVVTSGLAMQLTPVLPSVEYYATPGNQWPTKVIPFVPEWMRVQDEAAYKGFFEGIHRLPGYVEPERGYYSEPFVQGMYENWTYLRQIPWMAWMPPLLGWAIFLVPMYTFSICMMVIIRGQWMDREILVYPLTRLPSEMSRVEEEGAERGPEAPALGPLFRSGGMWLGFAIPVVFTSLQAINAYYMGFPMIQLSWDTTVMSDQVTLYIVPSFVAMGFTYLVNTRVSFSVWSLSLVGLFVSGWLALRGYKSPENLGGYGSGNPLMYHMGMGALLTMAVIGLWSARAHLAGVFRKAFTGDPSVDDSKEILSYRLAVILAIVCAIIMLAWLMTIGMQWWVALTFWLVAMLVFYGLTRIVAEAGLGSVVPPGIASGFTISKLGASSMSSGSIVGLGLQFPYSADVRTFVMASAANGLKLTQEIEQKRRRLFVALFGAMVVALVISIGTIIYLSYVYQGTSLERWYYRDAPAIGLNYAKDMIGNTTIVDGQEVLQRTGANVQGWVFSIVGVAAMALLMFAQRRFLRWPLHPIGLAVVGTWIMDRLWFSVFIAWLVKTLILKYGGPRLYMRTIPFFLGLVLGQCVSAGAWCLIDYVTGTVGNVLFRF